MWKRSKTETRKRFVRSSRARSKPGQRWSNHRKAYHRAVVAACERMSKFLENEGIHREVFIRPDRGNFIRAVL